MKNHLGAEPKELKLRKEPEFPSLVSYIVLLDIRENPQQILRVKISIKTVQRETAQLET